jgi:molybdopterin molybdotransferase
MISEEEARSKILEAIQRLPARRIPLASALDCFTAEDLFARVPLPNFDNSAMDGYAVVTSSCAPGKRLRVVGEQPAGVDQHLGVNSGEAVRIFTGAPIPAGANAVVMQEDVVRERDEIIVNVEVDPGEFVRKRGCDLAEGQKILMAGERIRAATAALLASQGFAQVAVGGEVTAGILSTGDELAKPGTKLQPGQIYESNSVLLAALLQRAGAIVNSVEHCRDDFDSLGDAIKRGAQSRILVISGGVSVGAHDFVQRALEFLGARIDIWRVAIKPGKPFLFGCLKQSRLSPPTSAALRRSRQSSPSGRGGREAPGEGSAAPLNECVVFGLPGNPVSSFVTFLRFVRPAILKMMGATQLEPPKVAAKLTVDLKNSDEARPHYVRGKFESGAFVPVGRQESHALFGLSQSNALVRVPAGGELNRGSDVEVELLD